MRSLLLTCLLAGSFSGAPLAAPAGPNPLEAPKATTCRIGTLTDPDQPDLPRIALYRRRPEEPCDELVLDTGVPLSAALPRWAARLPRSRGMDVSCPGGGKESGLPDWEEVFIQILAPGFQGEMLLHRGRVEEALAVFTRGLPDLRSEAWLAEAARKLPLSVASILPRPLEGRNVPRADSALTVLEALVSSHPAAAEGMVRLVLSRGRRPVLARAIRLAGEEAAGLRMVRGDSPEADALRPRIEAALGDRDPAVRGAAAQAILLAVPNVAGAVPSLSAALAGERDPAARLEILSALGEAGGLEAIRPLTRSEANDLRRDALRVLSEFTDDASERSEALIRLLDEGVSPNEVVRRLSAAPESARDSRWTAVLPPLLPSLGEEERARVPFLLCRIPEAEGGGSGAPVALRMAREDPSPSVALAAIRALGVCADPNPAESVGALLEIAEDSRHPREMRIAAAETAGALAASGPAADRLAESLGRLLSSSEEDSEEPARSGLLAFGLGGAIAPATVELLKDALDRPGTPAGAASERALRRLHDVAPGPLIRAIRDQGPTLSEPLQQAAWDLIQRFHRESEERSMARFREELAASGARIPDALLAELIWRADYWPPDILELSRPVFESSREEERIRLLELMIALGRHVPDDVLPLLSAPEGSSVRVRRATREARAAVLARRTVELHQGRPEELMAMALNPLDAESRADGRRGLWLLAWENPTWRPWLGSWIGGQRSTAPLPLRVELGRIAAQLKEMGPRTSWVWPPGAGEAGSKAASCPRDTCGDSAPALSGRPRRGAGTESGLRDGSD